MTSDQRVEVIVEDGPEGGPLVDLVRRTALIALGRTRRDDPDDDGLSGHSAGVTILLTDDDTLRSLNRQFADEDKVTDVLAFSGGAVFPGDATEQFHWATSPFRCRRRDARPLRPVSLRTGRSLCLQPTGCSTCWVTITLSPTRNGR